MNLVIDIGNTRFKAATFNGAEIEKKYFFQTGEELKHFLNHHTFDSVIVSSVSFNGNELLDWITASRKFLLTHLTPLPLKLKYETPETLGVDRIAAACGALEICPDKDFLVIDAGTCITYDFVDRAKNYLGGSISPGIEMRFEALHTFTQRLPLVTTTGDSPLIGNTTEICIRSGVLNGALAEVDGIIDKYKVMYPGLGVVLCGGDSLFFENKLKHTIFAAPDLVLSGLNRILRHNAAL